MGLKLISSACIILLASFYVASKASNTVEVMDDTDLCILTCYECFEEQILLKCANTCIKFKGKPPPIWKMTCPLFNNAERELMLFAQEEKLQKA